MYWTSKTSRVILYYFIWHTSIETYRLLPRKKSKSKLTSSTPRPTPRLLDNHYFESQNQDQELGYARSPMREKGLFEANSLLRPFSDHELLRDFHKCVREMKD